MVERIKQDKRASVASYGSPWTVSIVIAARDEANSIAAVVDKIRDSLFGYPYEVVVIDDGSRDKTKEVAGRHGTLVVCHKRVSGKGTAMKTGVNNATGDVLVFLDGDGAHEPQDIPRIIAPILERRADFVIGSRALPESKVFVSSLTRRLSNRLASFIISFISSFLLPVLAVSSRLTSLFNPNKPYQPIQPTKRRWVRITDCTSGFRAITRESWQKLNLISEGFQIETEMIYEAARNKLTITEVPITCNWDSKFSHLSILGDGLKTLKLLTRKIVNDIGHQ